MPLPKDPEQAAITRERMRQAHLGKKATPATRAKMRKAQQARRKTEGYKPRPDMLGANNPMRQPEIAAKLRGEGNGRYLAIPSYGGAHDRLDAQRGLATTRTCEVCGKRGHEWALSHEAPLVEIDGHGHVYSLDINDYVAMCRSCHRRYDRGTLSL